MTPVKEDEFALCFRSDAGDVWVSLDSVDEVAALLRGNPSEDFEDRAPTGVRIFSGRGASRDNRATDDCLVCGKRVSGHDKRIVAFQLYTEGEISIHYGCGSKAAEAIERVWSRGGHTLPTHL